MMTEDDAINGNDDGKDGKAVEIVMVVLMMAKTIETETGKEMLSNEARRNGAAVMMVRTDRERERQGKMMKPRDEEKR